MEEELGRLLIQFWLAALPFPVALVGVGVKMPGIEYSFSGYGFKAQITLTYW